MTFTRRLLATLALVVLAATPRAGATPAPAAPAPAAPAPAAARPSLPIPPLRLPVPVERTLGNGLRVVVLRQARPGIVHIQLMVPAGSAHEPADHAGVAALTASLLREGTASRTAAGFRDELGHLGVLFATGCERDYALVACGCASSALDGVLDLMSDAVTSPLFGGTAYEELRNNYARDLEAQHGALADAADIAVADAAFSPHPYAHPPAGDPRTIGSVELAAVQAFHRDRWRPDHAVLTLTGDVTPERAFAAAEDWFGRWSGTAAPEAARPAPQPARGVQVLDVPQANDAEVRVAEVGPGLGSPDYDAWALVVTALDGTEVPAGASPARIEGRDASLLVLAARCAPADAAGVARTLADFLRSRAHAAPTAGELAALRRRQAQWYPLTIGTLGSLTTQWQVLDLTAQAAGTLSTFGERIAHADFTAGSRAFAAPPVIVVAGAARALRAPLATAGLGAVTVRALGAPDTTANVPVTAEQRARGRALVAQALQAHGGAERLRGVQSLVLEGTINLSVGGQDLMGQFSASRVDPEQYSFATRMLKFESRQVVSGNCGWTLVKSDSTTVTELDSLEVEGLRAAAVSDLVHQLRFAGGPTGDPAWRGSAPVAGIACDLVEYSTPFGRQRLALDQRTHQVVEIAAVSDPRAGWLDHRVFSEYHATEGVVLPWIEDRTISGNRIWHMVATSAAVNRALPKSLFARPELPLH